MVSDQQKIKMSDDLPFEIQAAIIESLPVESLIRFRSVSKSWKSLIDSSRFIIAYHRSNRRSEVQHLLIRSSHRIPCEQDYVSIVDDHTFPRRKVNVTPPVRVKMLEYNSIVGTSQGLLCLHGDYFNDSDDYIPPTTMAIIWNIIIRKEVVVVVPNIGYGAYHTLLGFGVCCETLDPKIVKINQVNWRSDAESVTCIPWQVEVFTLSTGVWRNPYTSSNLPRKSVGIFGFQVTVDGILYWLARDRIIMDGEIMSYNLFISFDLKYEEFREISLPDSLAHNQSDQNLSIFKLKETLVVFEHEEDEMSFVVWRMVDGVTKTFTKSFKIHTPEDALIISIFGFRKSGEPLIEVKVRLWLNDTDTDSSLGVDEHHSKDISYLGHIDNGVSVSAYSYMETLLLLDHPNFIIYYKGKSYVSKQSGKNKRLLKHKSKGKIKEQILKRYKKRKA